MPPTKKRPFTPNELEQAYDIAGQIWREEVRLKVIERFGKAKAEAMQARIEEMTKAFFKIPVRQTGSTVMHDAKTVSKDFRAAYPDAPAKMIENLKVTYLTNNR